jgi:hypothetical protein
MAAFAQPAAKLDVPGSPGFTRDHKHLMNEQYSESPKRKP